MRAEFSRIALRRGRLGDDFEVGYSDIIKKQRQCRRQALFDAPALRIAAAFADSSDKIINAFVFRPEVSLKRIEVGYRLHILLSCKPFQLFSRSLSGRNVVVCYRIPLCPASGDLPTCFDRLPFQLSLPLCQLDHNIYQVFLFVRTKICILILVDWFKEAGIVQLVNAFLE